MNDALGLRFSDPRRSADRVLAVLDYYDEHDHLVPGASGAYLRYRALAAGLRNVAPTDVISMMVVRRSVGCGQQCGRCAGVRVLHAGDESPAPFAWSYCARAADVLAHAMRRAGRYNAVLLSGIQLHPYVPAVRALCRAPLVIDLHNAETDLHESMLAHPEWRDGRDDQRLRAIGAVERMLVGAADVVTVPSTSDRDALRRRHGVDTPVHILPNAVHVDPMTGAGTPRPPRKCVFVGDFRHFPNTLAALEIARSIGPAIRAADPHLPVVLAGRHPPPHLVDAVRDTAVTLVANPDSIDPILDEALLIVPLTLGGGTRLKILQAFARGIPVISTEKGIEGIDAAPYTHYLLAHTATEFADAVRHTVGHPALTRARIRRAWRLVDDRYSWTALAGPVRAVLLAAQRCPEGHP